jgi:5'-3' exonuclease
MAEGSGFPRRSIMIYDCNDDLVILVDCQNLAYRSFYAFPNLSFKDQKTGTFYGFLHAVLRLRQKISKRMVFCWDGGLPGDKHVENWRKRIWPKYKQSRKPSEGREIVQAQLPALHGVLGYIGYGSVGVPGLEADDVMSVLAHTRDGFVGNVAIHSSDHDMYQCLTADERVRVLAKSLYLEQGLRFKTGYGWVTQKSIMKQYGVHPLKWAAYLAMGGDQSDDIKPMKGMGPKTAMDLLSMGAMPAEPFTKQTIGLRTKYGRLEKCWPDIQAAYKVALLPATWTDPRIVKYAAIRKVNTVGQSQLTLAHGGPPRLKEFAQWLADRGLADLFAVRNQFFD